MSKTKRLQTIDGESLMSLPLTPLNFVVDTLLSQGLHILAGSPKVGKSWLALWLSIMVAKGEPVWGMSAKQGTTLYLCLEDSVLRIQNRLFEITEDAPSSVHFARSAPSLVRGWRSRWKHSSLPTRIRYWLSLTRCRWFVRLATQPTPTTTATSLH